MRLLFLELGLGKKWALCANPKAFSFELQKKSCQKG